jgi:hypothetical protein
MKVLVYYSKGNNYKHVANALTLEDHQPVILWADNFKEVNEDKGDALYICEDVPEDRRERIIQHFVGSEISLLENINELGEHIGGGEVPQFETLEEVEAYIVELQLELENAQELRDQFLKAAEQSAEQEQREENARIAKEKADKEAKEANEALAKAQKEQQEADDTAKAALEAEDLANLGAQESETDTTSETTDTTSETTDGEYEHPTREQMILELRGLKDEGTEVPIPRNATLAQIKPLYDEHIRKINGDA